MLVRLWRFRMALSILVAFASIGYLLVSFYLDQQPEANLVELTISSVPPNAHITVVSDGGETLDGDTPLTFKVPLGAEIEYTVIAREPLDYHLYKPHVDKATINEPTTINVWIERTTLEEQEVEIAEKGL